MPASASSMPRSSVDVPGHPAEHKPVPQRPPKRAPVVKQLVKRRRPRSLPPPLSASRRPWTGLWWSRPNWPWAATAIPRDWAIPWRPDADPACSTTSPAARDATFPKTHAWEAMTTKNPMQTERRAASTPPSSGMWTVEGPGRRTLREGVAHPDVDEPVAPTQPIRAASTCPPRAARALRGRGPPRSLRRHTESTCGARVWRSWCPPGRAGSLGSATEDGPDQFAAVLGRQGTGVLGQCADQA